MLISGCDIIFPDVTCLRINVRTVTFKPSQFDKYWLDLSYKIGHQLQTRPLQPTYHQHIQEGLYHVAMEGHATLAVIFLTS